MRSVASLRSVALQRKCLRLSGVYSQAKLIDPLFHYRANQSKDLGVER